MAFERSRSWQVPDLEAAEAAVHGWAREQGFDVTPKADDLELSRGSQVRMRSSGAGRADAQDLPLKGAVSWAGGDALELTLASDKVGMVLGVGPMSSGTEDRYEAAVGELVADLGRRLAGAS